MGQFRLGESVRVLITSPAINEQVGIIIDVAEVGGQQDEELFLVKFPDRFMRYYRSAELGPAYSTN